MAIETDEERKARLKKMVATKRLKLAMETDEKRKERLEKMVATTQLRLALETEKERIIWYSNRIFLNSRRNKPALPVMGTIFLVGEGDTLRSVQSRIAKNVIVRTYVTSIL